MDAIALARRHLWLASEGFSLSVADPDIQELVQPHAVAVVARPLLEVRSLCTTDL